MLSALDELAVELAGVGHVKVPHHHQGTRRPVAAAQVGMARAGIEFARGAVAQVADENFTTEVEVLLHARGQLRIQLFFANQFIEPLDFIAEQTRQRVFLGIAATENVRCA